MKTCVFDIETDGLLEDLTKVHCLLLYDIEEMEIMIGFGNREITQTTLQGSVDLIIENENGYRVAITLTEVIYMKSLVCNLVSLPTAMMKGF